MKGFLYIADVQDRFVKIGITDDYVKRMYNLRSLYARRVEFCAIWFFRDDSIAPAVELEVKSALYSCACLPSTEVFNAKPEYLINKVAGIIDRDALNFVRVL